MQVNKGKLKDFEELRIKLLISIVFILTIIIVSVIIIKFSIIKTEAGENTVYTYLTKSKVNYSVRYKPNIFFEEKVLGMNRQYTTNLVNTIEVDFGSHLILSKEKLVEYDYEILGVITGTYSSDSSRKETELWTRNFTLLEKKGGKASKKSNRIDEKILIDFNYYNDIVIGFKRELKLNIDAKFSAKMIINYTIMGKEQEENVSEELLIEFPLSKAAFVMTTKIPESKESKISTTYDGEVIINYPVLILAIIFLVISFILLIKFIIRVKIITMKTEYQKELNKILKNFGDIIVESKTLIDISSYEILEVHELDDLIDIENELRIPIIYYDKKPGMEGWFILIHGTLLYRYILYVKGSEDKYSRKH